MPCDTLSRGSRRRGLHRQSLAVVLAAAALGASACGGGAHTTVELQESVTASRDRVDVALERITEAQSQEELLERMYEAAATIDRASDDVDDLDASSGRERALDRLAKSLHQLAFDLQATADQIRQPGFGELVTGARGLSFESWNQVNEALAALRRTGIDVEPLAPH
jgi:hypothetical protein